MRAGETRHLDERTPIEIIRDLNEWWARRDFETVRELLHGRLPAPP
jgi:hypothetical protein